MHQPFTRIMPAQQRLDTLDATGSNVDLRLIMKEELVLIQRDTQLVLQSEPLGEMEQAARSNDLNGFVWANVDFYDRNTQLAENKAVKRILDSLLLRTLRLRRLSLSQPGRMQSSLDDSTRLVKAYEDRDANLARALTTRAVFFDQGRIAGEGDVIEIVQRFHSATK